MTALTYLMRDVKLTYFNLSLSDLRKGGAKGMGLEFGETVKALDEQISPLIKNAATSTLTLLLADWLPLGIHLIFQLHPTEPVNPLLLRAFYGVFAVGRHHLASK